MVLHLVVTGSRHLKDKESVHDLLDSLSDEHERIKVFVGDCPSGSDEFVRLWASEKAGFDKQVSYEVFYADWSLGKRAGPLRSRKMVESALFSTLTTSGLDKRNILVLAFFQVGAENIGTTRCVEYAESLDLDVISIDLR